DLERLPENVELVAFRVVQEALANVYHHSESAIARVHVAIERSPGTRRVVFKVEDSGKGLPDGPLLARLSFQNGRSDTAGMGLQAARERLDRKSTRLNSSHSQISYAVFCLKKKKKTTYDPSMKSILFRKIAQTDNLVVIDFAG